MTEATEGNKPRPPVPALMAGGQINAIIPQSMEEVWRISVAIHKSGTAPRGYKTAEAIMVGIMHGLEVGLTPFAALQSIAVINGTPAIWGDGMIALVEAADALDVFEESFVGEPYTDEWTAICRVKRRGRTREVIGDFSVADAKRAGLWDERETVRRRDGTMGQNDAPWRRYPKRMLKMRARAFALRDSCADILRGLRMREEVEDIARDEVAETPPAPPPPPPPRLAAPSDTVVVLPMAADENTVQWANTERDPTDWTPDPDADSAVISVTDEAGNPAELRAGDVISDAVVINAPPPNPPPPPPPPRAVAPPRAEGRKFDPDLFIREVEKVLSDLTADDPSAAETLAGIDDMVEAKRSDLFPPDYAKLREMIDAASHLTGS